ncbi:undecaprenyl-phosphate glucose phosphotransferase [Serratia proteamaculans]|uniref:undecaprenyl-phosphate glucose phosphotransferase n=1 Tax=Serratia proteamaculans TaxID=28151 RepID=UPI0039B0A076
MNGLRHHTIRTNVSITSLLQRCADITIMLLGACISSYFEYSLFSTSYILLFLLSLVSFQLVGGVTEFYRSWRGVKISLECKTIFVNWSLSFVFSYLISSRLDFIKVGALGYTYFYLIVLSGLLFGRVIIRLGLGYLRKLGFNIRNVAIIGSMPKGILLGETLKRNSWTGFNVLGFYDNTSDNIKTSLAYRGDFSKLVKDAKSGKIDRVYISMPMSAEKEIVKIVTDLTDSTCSVMLVPDVFTFDLLHSRSEEIDGTTVVSLFDTPMSGMNKVMKRIEDILLSSAIIVFISPVMLLISLIVKFTSPGPVIFKQKRYGIDGKSIEVWKFRSMSVMENGDKVVQAKKGDLRITPAGRFLRRTSLDELPQFFNVLKGDMSIVGPRPHAIAHNEEYRKSIRGYMLRHKVKPGITGLAQINGWRGETDTLDKMEKRIECDLEYIRTWSILLDIKIIFLTIFKGFVNKSAY